MTISEQLDLNAASASGGRFSGQSFVNHDANDSEFLESQHCHRRFESFFL